ncbi:hypothetical protein TNCV_939741 [Trichonephila clavipes]|nr:hypothetical protein TNCV_939741 [Trichonephila clavipes]
MSIQEAGDRKGLKAPHRAFLGSSHIKLRPNGPKSSCYLHSAENCGQNERPNLVFFYNVELCGSRSDVTVDLVVIAIMPLRKRSVRALQMNEKRWCKAKVDCEVNKNSVFSNVRLEKLNTVVKKDTSAIGNYILVDFNQVNNLLRSAKCQYCEKQTLKLELGAKLGFSYNLKLLCSNCDENKTVVNTSLKSVQTSHDVNLRITQAFHILGKVIQT